jgi:ABC-type phosphate/phosphonate transport system substrate-binding protein
MKSLLITSLLAAVQLMAATNLTCWFAPKTDPAKAKAITEMLSKSGNTISPRVATSYAEILTALEKPDPQLVFVGSFVQAMIKDLSLGTPIVQAIDGKEFYSGILVYPEAEKPDQILTNTPSEIAYAKGASSGESSAKAATGGKASIGVANHEAAVNAVKAGKAKAAVVKSWWWESNKSKFPGMASYEIPGVSEAKNPDNVLTANKAVDKATIEALTATAKAGAAAFGAKEMKAFDTKNLDFTLSLMKKGGITPKSYQWE